MGATRTRDQHGSNELFDHGPASVSSSYSTRRSARTGLGIARIWPAEGFQIPVTSAISTRRKQMPVMVMRCLFEQAGHPLATPQSKGAFALGLWLMAIDATLDNVIETQANLAHFPLDIYTCRTQEKLQGVPSESMAR